LGGRDHCGHVGARNRQGDALLADLLGLRVPRGVRPAAGRGDGVRLLRDRFPAFGGREIFDPTFSKPIEDGDVLSFAREVAQALTEFEKDPTEIRRAGERAAEHVRRTYSPQRQRTELMRFVDQLLKSV